RFPCASRALRARRFPAHLPDDADHPHLPQRIDPQSVTRSHSIFTPLLVAIRLVPHCGWGPLLPLRRAESPLRARARRWDRAGYRVVAAGAVAERRPWGV